MYSCIAWMSRSLRVAPALPSISRARQPKEFVFKLRVPQHRKLFHTVGAFEAGIRDRLHLGAQLYVSLGGDVLIDAGFGEAREGVSMTSDTITLWFSAGKPLTAVAIAQLVERGLISWNTR